MPTIPEIREMLFDVIMALLTLPSIGFKFWLVGSAVGDP